MPTPVRSRQDLDAPVEEVLAVLTSTDWVQRRGTELRDGSVLVSREEGRDGAVLLVVSRELPGGVPGFLQRFLPQDGRVLQTEQWTAAPAGAARSGSWAVEVPGTPARLSGTVRLEPTGSGSHWAVEGEASIGIPLVGGRAERLVVDAVSALNTREFALLRDVLREQRGQQ